MIIDRRSKCQILQTKTAKSKLNNAAYQRQPERYQNGPSNRYNNHYPRELNNWHQQFDKRHRFNSNEDQPICRHFQNGYCRYGNNCRFSHGMPCSYYGPAASSGPAAMMQNTPRMHNDLAAGNKENDDGELEEGEIIEDNNFDSFQEAKMH